MTPDKLDFTNANQKPASTTTSLTPSGALRDRLNHKIVTLPVLYPNFKLRPFSPPSPVSSPDQTGTYHTTVSTNHPTNAIMSALTNTQDAPSILNFPTLPKETILKILTEITQKSKS
ncbi:Neutrophil collagenase [Fusarium oxysporum f. sp. albedinis]|nr:Neutrophil collagenase [Fusarium oxysporum f. sp. albedinis]